VIIALLATTSPINTSVRASGEAIGCVPFQGQVLRGTDPRRRFWAAILAERSMSGRKARPFEALAGGGIDSRGARDAPQFALSIRGHLWELVRFYERRIAIE
jgi:hypothetical protein